MNYWSETMQDDCYLIAANGWKAELYTPQPAAKKRCEAEREESFRTGGCRVRLIARFDCDR